MSKTPTLADLFADAPALAAPQAKPSKADPAASLARFRTAYERWAALMTESYVVGDDLHAANAARKAAEAKLATESPRIPRGEAYLRGLDERITALKREIVNSRDDKQPGRIAASAKLEADLAAGAQLLADVKADCARLEREAATSLARGRAAEARLTEIEQQTDALAVEQSDAEAELKRLAGVTEAAYLCPSCWKLIGSVGGHAVDCTLVKGVQSLRALGAGEEVGGG